MPVWSNRRLLLVHPQDRGLALPDDAEGHLVAAGDPESPALGGVAFGDALAELPAVRLGLVGLADELVPGARVRGEQPLIGEEHDDTGGMEVILDRDERLLDVPQEPGHVAHDEDIEATTLGGLIIVSHVAVLSVRVHHSAQPYRRRRRPVVTQVGLVGARGVAPA